MSTQHSVLIVDDEPDIRELLHITVQRMGHAATTAATRKEAEKLLRDGAFDLCLTDMKLPDGTGLDVIHTAQKHQPSLPIAVITAFGSVDLAIDSLKAGAFDFITKPLDIAQLRELIRSALRVSTRDSASTTKVEARLLGDSEAIGQLRKQIEKLSRSQAPVHIAGESGSGKEVVARLIHANSSRDSGPFIAVNCGAIPDELVESELFGHIKGSFTGAHENKQGLFEAANGGTLFLDEIADLPIATQVKLLRAIQEKRVRAVGASEERPVDVRILSATHKDLAQQVEKGLFRTDLYYRVNVIEVRVPALREHPEDIKILSDAILSRLSRDWTIDKPKIHDAAIDLLSTYDFPGNVRELENILERAATLCERGVIYADDLHLPKPRQDSGELRDSEPLLRAINGDLESWLTGIETRALSEALEQSKGNKTEAARILGISFRQFRYRLDKLGLGDNSGNG